MRFSQNRQKHTSCACFKCVFFAFPTCLSLEPTRDRPLEQLIELQSQLAFQENAIRELDEAVATQQADILELQRQWDMLREQYRELQAGLPGESVAADKPPHY